MTMVSHTARLTGLVLALHIGATPTAAQTLSHLTPAVVRRGATTPVTCIGKGLAGVNALWTTFQAEAKLAEGTKPTDVEAKFTITVPADAPVGIFGVRVASETGISDVRLCVVDDLPIVAKAAGNQDFARAQKVPLPTALSGTLDAEQRDFYEITVTAGQRVAFDVIGSRFGVDFDPLLRIWSKDQKEIVSYDNDEGLGFDARFEHVFAQAGNHFLEIRDTRYQGGTNYTYVVRMGDLPIARVAYPAGFRRGRWASVAFPGKNATDVPPINVEIPANPADDLAYLIAAGTHGSAWVPFAYDELDPQLELEPNDDPAQANATIVPRTLNGRLQAKGDIDCFRFPAQKDQQIAFTADTRRLSSPADLYIRVFDATGKQVAVADDTGAEDAQFVFKAPADGTYVLAIEDLHRRGGPEFVYRVTADNPPRDFAVEQKTDRLVVPQGSTAPVLVSINRKGYAGPVRLSLEGANEKLACAGGDVAAGAKEGAVAVRAALDAPLGLSTVRIIGTGTRDNQPVVHGGDLSAFLAPKLANLRLMPPTVVRSIPVLVTARVPFSLAAKLDAPFVARHAKTPITVLANKEKFFDEEITLAVENLPADLALAVKPIKKGDRSVQLEFESKPKVPLGVFPIVLRGTAKREGWTGSVYADVLYVSIQPAFSLTVAPAEVKIARGGKIEIVVRADRHPSFAGALDLTLNNLPKGITAKPAKIAEKETEARVELSAAADAPPATAANLTATGKAKVGSQAETVNSPAVKIVVTEK